ncbi:pctA [Symbiodinium sp. CCMP2592]|nr:pctA [Symbiodinium sp. CCMP2592]
MIRDNDIAPGRCKLTTCQHGGGLSPQRNDEVEGLSPRKAMAEETWIAEHPRAHRSEPSPQWCPNHYPTCVLTSQRAVMGGQAHMDTIAEYLNEVRELAEAKEQLAGAESQCILAQCAPQGSPRPIRIFIDGVFDLTHYGHMNAFRQARALGEYLVVGVNSDESVQKAKGFRPVLTDDERQAAVAACRFVDEIVPASPYIMTEAYIQDLVENRGIDYFVHGDDPCIVDGRDVYESARKAGRFCTIPRTEGISTTDIVGRLLLLTQDHHTELVTAAPSSGARPSAVFASQQSNFLVTSQLLRAFSGALPGTLPKGLAKMKRLSEPSWQPSREEESEEESTVMV